MYNPFQWDLVLETTEYEIEIKTDRLVLRHFNGGDVDDVFEYSDDPEFARFLGTPQPFTRWEAEKWVARQVLTPWDTTPMFAIQFEGKVIGFIKLNVEKKHNRAHMAYGLSKSYWGKGIVPEAANAMLDWGFGELGLDKIFAGADGENVQSQRVMEKMGMVREAYLKSHIIARNERAVQVLYGILRDEWSDIRGK